VKQCPVCSREFSDERNFCPFDGKRLPAASAAPADPPAQPSAADASHSYGRIDITLAGGETMHAPLVAPQTTIGYDKENDITINDPAVSGKHAFLKLQGDEWFIFDAGSLNGVLVNKERVGQQGRRVNNGDKVTIGGSHLTITLRISKQFKTVVDMPAPVEKARPNARPRPPAPVSPPASKKGPEGVSPQTGKGRQAERLNQPGKILDGRYQLEAEIAKGSTGTVYRARRVLLGDKVAIKILHQGLIKDSMAVERFRRQAQVAARVHHPNSVQIYDFGVSSDGDVYIVEELLSRSEEHTSELQSHA